MEERIARLEKIAQQLAQALSQVTQNHAELLKMISQLQRESVAYEQPRHEIH